MGNTCVGPNLGEKGILQSVTAAVWRTRPPGNTLPAPNSEGSTNNTNNSSSNANSNSATPKGPETKGSDPQTPPAAVKIAGEKTEVKDKGGGGWGTYEANGECGT